MTQTTHTPGPWIWEVDPDGDHLRIETAETEPRAIVGGCGCCGSPYTDHHHAEANARLIAAAPDLLAALEEMAAVFGWQSPNANPAVDTAIAAARAAIAKAKGE